MGVPDHVVSFTKMELWDWEKFSETKDSFIAFAHQECMHSLGQLAAWRAAHSGIVPQQPDRILPPSTIEHLQDKQSQDCNELLGVLMSVTSQKSKV